MTNDTSFTMSQDLELVQPQKKSAYPIPIEEWTHIKKKIGNISDNANIYHTIGSALIGVAGSALVAALTSTTVPGGKATLWFIFVSALICGVLSICFGRTQRQVQNVNTTDVIEQMNLIEKRYEPDANSI